MTLDDANVKMEDVPPNHTLYVKNLNDKIKQDRMTAALYASFSQHGKLLEVLMGKGRKLRGQAWVTFDDIASSSNALRAMNGFVLFEKSMVIQFGKEKADVIARREGTFQPREKRKLDAPAGGDSVSVKKAASGENGHTPAHAPPPPPPVQILPNKILFLQDLPESCNKEMLSVLFKQYHGFKEVRMVPGKKGLAFVEFGDDAQASIALQGLYGFKLTPTDALKVSFAKK
ncbi:U1 small nuclear ribonucleoprotein a, partial [Globisporangium splendens]